MLVTDTEIVAQEKLREPWLQSPQQLYKTDADALIPAQCDHNMKTGYWH